MRKQYASGEEIHRRSPHSGGGRENEGIPPSSGTPPPPYAEDQGGKQKPGKGFLCEHTYRSFDSERSSSSEIAEFLTRPPQCHSIGEDAERVNGKNRAKREFFCSKK
jgi:hypothetical protein